MNGQNCSNGFRTATAQTLRTPRTPATFTGALADFDAVMNALFTQERAPGTAGPAAPTFTPPMTVWSDATNAYVELELPGFKMDQIELTLQRDVLTIKGQRTRQWPEGTEVVRDERSDGTFERNIRLGDTIDGEKIAAALNAGVLTITMPRRPESQPRKITVAGGN